MRTPTVPFALALALGGALVAVPAAAQLQLPNSINQPPSGAGTENLGPRGAVEGFHPGVTGAAGIGTGFSDTYGLGLLARAGYVFRNGVYAGGQVQYYAGHSVNDQSAHATFVGGEVGYEIYPTQRLEVRPFAFVGPAFITQVTTAPVTSISTTGLAIQPGVIGMYHFGDAFVGGDVHYMVTPGPNTLAVMASAGFGF